ncbi:MAG: hypothetical protein N3A66_10905, partial [Planctomycetota bacterium]|nr:hypothetical protein [Planctomycetota bacterium]
MPAPDAAPLTASSAARAASTSAPEYPLLSVAEMIEAASHLAADINCFGIVTSGPALSLSEVARVAEAAAAI